eukprot:TRINITY_DN23725_c1_g2_i1.p1 TRINITY_DN23725_c1_g2~~TRINITY_DN23725_c1_g2_i1.p1  ORF type:complete len:811 (-),score=72.58 TRINITY_DN23725_c1_g2_i1:40-2472(-)
MERLLSPPTSKSDPLPRGSLALSSPSQSPYRSGCLAGIDLWASSLKDLAKAGFDCSRSSSSDEFASARASSRSSLCGSEKHSGSEKMCGSENEKAAGSEKHSGSEKNSGQSGYAATEWEFPMHDDFLHPEAFLYSGGSQMLPGFPIPGTPSEMLQEQEEEAWFPDETPHVAPPNTPCARVTSPECTKTFTLPPVSESAVADTTSEVVTSYRNESRPMASGPVLVVAGRSPTEALRAAAALGKIVAGGKISFSGNGSPCNRHWTLQQSLPCPDSSSALIASSTAQKFDSDTLNTLPWSLATTANRCEESDVEACVGPSDPLAFFPTTAVQPQSERPSRAGSAPPGCRSVDTDIGAGGDTEADGRSKQESVSGTARTRTYRAGRRVAAKRQRIAAAAARRAAATASKELEPEASSKLSSRAARSGSAPPVLRPPLPSASVDTYDPRMASAPATTVKSNTEDVPKKPRRRAGQRVRERRLLATTRAESPSRVATSNVPDDAVSGSLAVYGDSLGDVRPAGMNGSDMLNRVVGAPQSISELPPPPRYPAPMRNDLDSKPTPSIAPSTSTGVSGPRKSFYPKSGVTAKASSRLVHSGRATTDIASNDGSCAAAAVVAGSSSLASTSATLLNSSVPSAPRAQNTTTASASCQRSVPKAARDAGNENIIGSWVLVRDLVQSAQFNGQWGLAEAYDASLGRYLVRVLMGDENGATQPVLVKLRRENFVVLPRSAADAPHPAARATPQLTIGTPQVASAATQPATQASAIAASQLAKAAPRPAAKAPSATASVPKAHSAASVPPAPAWRPALSRPRPAG